MSDEAPQRRDRGNAQRNKIPRTTQVKRLHREAKSGKPLRAWAREFSGPLTDAWLAGK